MHEDNLHKLLTTPERIHLFGTDDIELIPGKHSYLSKLTLMTMNSKSESFKTERETHLFTFYKKK